MNTNKAQTNFKRQYRMWKKSRSESVKRDWREDMYDQRYAAGLERRIAAQQRTIESLEFSLEVARALIWS